jgi:hypothetical protein
VKKQIDELTDGDGGPVPDHELRLLEIAREAVEGWGDGTAPLEFKVFEFELLGQECARLAADALDAWSRGDRDGAADRAAQAATIEGLVTEARGGYHRLYEVLRGQQEN